MARRVLAVEAQMMRHQSPYVTALQKKKKKTLMEMASDMSKAAANVPWIGLVWMNWVRLLLSLVLYSHISYLMLIGKKAGHFCCRKGLQCGKQTGIYWFDVFVFLNEQLLCVSCCSNSSLLKSIHCEHEAPFALWVSKFKWRGEWWINPPPNCLLFNRTVLWLVVAMWHILSGFLNLCCFFVSNAF